MPFAANQFIFVWAWRTRTGHPIGRISCLGCVYVQTHRRCGRGNPRLSHVVPTAITIDHRITSVGVPSWKQLRLGLRLRLRRDSRLACGEFEDHVWDVLVGWAGAEASPTVLPVRDYRSFLDKGPGLRTYAGAYSTLLDMHRLRKVVRGQTTSH